MSVAFDEVSPEAPQGGGGEATVAPESKDFKGRTKEMDNELLSWGQEKYNLHRNERLPMERQWYINLAFHFGRQNISILQSEGNNLGFNLVTPKAPPWRVRMVINHCRRVIRTEISKLASQRPRPFVVPATTEDEDQSAARVGETILEAEFASHKFGTLNRSWIWWGSVTGTSFLKMYWDKDAEFKDGKKKKKGKICIERLTPFEFLVPNLNEEEIENQPYVIHAKTMDVDEVKAVFDVDVQPNAIGLTDLMEDAFLNLVGAAQLRKNKALILEFWIKPGRHKQFPKGGMFTMAGDKLVQVVDDGLPYNHDEFPFYKYSAMFSGKFYGDSILVDAIPLQREINRTRSQIIENKNLMSKPKMLAQRGSVNAKLITSEPGQVIYYQPGFDKPDILDPPQMPNYVAQELERLGNDLDDISGQHEITRGNNPSQVTAATALSYLQEQDDSKLYYNVASIEDATSKLGTHYLELVTQYWETERMVKIVGEEGIIEAEAWKGSDLNGNTDVRVMTGSGLPQSKAAKQAFIMDLLKFGFLPPEKGIEMLEIGGMDKIYQEVLTDKRAAMRENIIMTRLTPEQITKERRNKAAEALIKNADPSVQGVGETALQYGNTAEQAIQAVEEGTEEPVVPVNSWDNHQLHIQYHNNFRKTQRFSMLPDEVKQEFELHVVAHQRAMIDEQARMQGQDPDAPQQGGVAQQGQGQDPEAQPYEMPEGQQGTLDNSFTGQMNNANVDGVQGMGTMGLGQQAEGT